MLHTIVAKLTSGKFLLTIITGLVFAVLAVNKTLPPDKVMEVILLVIYGYFTRKNGDTQRPTEPPK
jgi:hypothetical protein